MTHSTSELNIQQAIDDSKFSLFHWTLIILGFLILAIDGFDTAAMGYIAPSVAKDWGIVKQDLGPVLSAALLGLSLGALIAGPISDRIGRKRVLVFSCLFFGLSSGHRLRRFAQQPYAVALPHRSRAGGGDAQRHYLDLRIRAAALPFAGDQHHVLRFSAGRGRRRRHFIVADRTTAGTACCCSAPSRRWY